MLPVAGVCLGDGGLGAALPGLPQGGDFLLPPLVYKECSLSLPRGPRPSFLIKNKEEEGVRAGRSTVAVSLFLQSSPGLRQTPWPPLEAGSSEEAAGTDATPPPRQLWGFLPPTSPGTSPSCPPLGWHFLGSLGPGASTGGHKGDEATSLQPGAHTGV